MNSVSGYRKPFFAINNEIVKYLPIREMIIYSTIVRYTNSDNTCFVDYDYIAKTLHIDRRTAKKYIKNLVNKNLIMELNSVIGVNVYRLDPVNFDSEYRFIEFYPKIVIDSADLSWMDKALLVKLLFYSKNISSDITINKLIKYKIFKKEDRSFIYRHLKNLISAGLVYKDNSYISSHYKICYHKIYNMKQNDLKNFSVFYKNKLKYIFNSYIKGQPAYINDGNISIKNPVPLYIKFQNAIMTEVLYYTESPYMFNDYKGFLNKEFLNSKKILYLNTPCKNATNLIASELRSEVRVLPATMDNVCNNVNSNAMAMRKYYKINIIKNNLNYYLNKIKLIILKNKNINQLCNAKSENETGTNKTNENECEGNKPPLTPPVISPPSLQRPIDSQSGSEKNFKNNFISFYDDFSGCNNYNRDVWIKNYFRNLDDFYSESKVLGKIGWRSGLKSFWIITVGSDEQLIYDEIRNNKKNVRKRRLARKKYKRWYRFKKAKEVGKEFVSRIHLSRIRRRYRKKYFKVLKDNYDYIKHLLDMNRVSEVYYIKGYKDNRYKVFTEVFSDVFNLRLVNVKREEFLNLGLRMHNCYRNNFMKDGIKRDILKSCLEFDSVSKSTINRLVNFITFNKVKFGNAGNDIFEDTVRPVNLLYIMKLFNASLVQ